MSWAPLRLSVRLLISGKHVAMETEKWGKLIKAANINGE